MVRRRTAGPCWGRRGTGSIPARGRAVAARDVVAPPVKSGEHEPPVRLDWLQDHFAFVVAGVPAAGGRSGALWAADDGLWRRGAGRDGGRVAATCSGAGENSAHVRDRVFRQPSRYPVHASYRPVSRTVSWFPERVAVDSIVAAS